MTSPQQKWPTRAKLGLTGTVAALTAAAAAATFHAPAALFVGLAFGTFVYSLIEGTRKDEWRGWHVATVVLVAFLACSASFNLELIKSHALAGTIVSPEAESSVPERLSGVHGTVKNLRAGDVIWPTVKIVGDPDAYLTAAPCAVKPAGKWACRPIVVQHIGRTEIDVRVLTGAQQQAAIDLLTSTPRRYGPFNMGTVISTVDVARDR